MSIELEWHPSLPILQATYTGTLSGNEYYAMCHERRALLDDGPEGAILLADTHLMERFADAPTVKRCDSAIRHAKVAYLLVVLNPALYRALQSGIQDTARFDFPVRFFVDCDTALECAHALLHQA